MTPAQKEIIKCQNDIKLSHNRDDDLRGYCVGVFAATLGMFLHMWLT